MWMWINLITAVCLTLLSYTKLNFSERVKARNNFRDTFCFLLHRPPKMHKLSD